MALDGSCQPCREQEQRAKAWESSGWPGSTDCMPSHLRIGPLVGDHRADRNRGHTRNAQCAAASRGLSRTVNASVRCLPSCCVMILPQEGILHRSNRKGGCGPEKAASASVPRRWFKPRGDGGESPRALTYPRSWRVGPDRDKEDPLRRSSSADGHLLHEQSFDWEATRDAMRE